MLLMSHGTIVRWRAGDYSPLHPSTRRQIVAFLRKRNGPAVDADREDAGGRSTIQDDVLEESLRMVDRVIRMLDGREGLTEEMRRDLKVAAVDEYILEWKELGREPAPLLLRWARIQRGEL